MNNAYLKVKRVFDVIVSLVLLLSLSWLFLIIFILYLFSWQWPILFKQERIGKYEITFALFKFRTLKNIDAPLQDRRFWLGDFLRFTSLDELPQLFQVVKGDMSLIGPRPLPIIYLSRFNDVQRLRHQVLPGITGWAQVNGRNGLRWDDKFALDLFYVNNISAELDFVIILKTIILLLSFKKDTSLHEKEFTGTNHE